MEDAQAVEWKEELKEFVKVNDERGVEGNSQFKTSIYKISYLIIYNPGIPVNDKQFFDLLYVFLLFERFKIDLQELISWTKPQVQARSHPNLLATTTWLSKLYHIQVAETGTNSEKNGQSANTLEGVDLNIPLTYADRFRIRKPGTKWVFSFNPPHVDGAWSYILCLPANLIQDTC